MAVVIVDFLRDAKTGNGIPGRTVSLRTVAGNTEIATAMTDANGMFSFDLDDIGYPGPIYYIVGDGAGVFKRHSGQSFGQAGAIWFDAMREVLSGLGKGVMNGLAVSADGSGMKVSVAPGTALLKDGIPYYWEDTEEVAIAAADVANPRFDLIVLRTTRVGQAEQGKCELVAIAGTPDVSPTVPSPVATSATDDLVLAIVQVDAGASVIAANKVSDQRFMSGQEIVSVPFNGAGIAAGTVGNAQLDSGAVTNSKVAAGIDAAKIANGSVSNAEFQYINGVTSAIQTQLNAKADLSGAAFTGDVSSTGNVTVDASKNFIIDGGVGTDTFLGGDGFSNLVIGNAGGVAFGPGGLTTITSDGMSVAINKPISTSAVIATDVTAYGTGAFTSGVFRLEGDTVIRVAEASVNPTLTIGAAAGTGGSAAVSWVRGGSDSGGAVRVRCGASGTSTGTIVSVTFNTPKADSNYMVLFGEYSVAAEAARISITNKTTSGFEIRANAAPAADSQIDVDLLVVEVPAT